MKKLVGIGCAGLLLSLNILSGTVIAAPVVLRVVQVDEASQEWEQQVQTLRERQVAEEAARTQRDAARLVREEARLEREVERRERDRQRDFERAFRDARRALDEGRLDEARERFRALAQSEGADSASLFWLAYADAQTGRISDALATLSDFFQRFPGDAYFDDALALRIELAQKGGELDELPPLPPEAPQPPSVFLRELGLGEAFDQAMEALARMRIGNEIEEAITEAFAAIEGEFAEEFADVFDDDDDDDDGNEFVRVEEELRLIALDGLMDSNPDRAIGYLQSFLAGDSSSAARRQALTLLAHSDHPDASQILLDTVRDGQDRRLRSEALRLLGLALGPQEGARALLGVYDELEDMELRRAAIEGLMLADDVDGLLEVLRKERSPELRAHTVRYLGMLDALDELRSIYDAEDDPQVLAAMLDGFALAGDTQMLIEVALASDDPALVERAVRAMAVAGSDDSVADALVDLYARHESDAPVQRVVAETLAAMGAGESLVALYRGAEDARERAMLAEHLRIVGGEAAESVFLEILEAGR